MKCLLRLMFRVPAIFFIASYRLGAACLGKDRAFLGLTERLAKASGFVGVYLRAAVYSHLLAGSSEEIHIGFGTVFSKTAAQLQDHVYIGRYCSLGWVHLEKDVMLADYVAIPSGGNTHRLSATSQTPPRLSENEFRCVRIGEGTWVGTQAVILADVGRFCVIGAGAVVTRPIPDGSVAIGVPARVVGSSSDDNCVAVNTADKSEQ